MKFTLNGVIPAMITPFKKGGEEIDFDRACALAERLVKTGVHGLFVGGTTGEGMLMTLDERKVLLEEIIAAVGKRSKIIAHTGCLDTAGVIELTRHARDAGADAVAVVAPGFYSYDDDALYHHYVHIAKQADGIPILAYNIPRSAINVLSPKLIIRLSAADSIVGVKDSQGDLIKMADVIAGAPIGFNVINGSDPLTIQSYLTGANGSVSATANVAPKVILSIYDNFKKGNIKKAQTQQKRLHDVRTMIALGQGPGRYKEALRLAGFDAGYVRLPGREPTRTEKRAIAEAFERYNVGALV